MNIVHKSYDELFSLDSILAAWNTFRRGKTCKKDVMDFEMHLEDNIFDLFEQMQSGQYTHLPYVYFQIYDNKKRDIYKAIIRDRIVHQIVYDYLGELFEPAFISDSYASRENKGQYKAVSALRYFVRLEGGYGSDCFLLKCDVKKYFDNIDQGILLELIKGKIVDSKVICVVAEVLRSYTSIALSKGVPLGNITSQIFANIYLNVLDQYIKKELRCRFYVRYNDDIVIVSKDREFLVVIREKILAFIKQRLFLEIPTEKTSIRRVAWGMDFLGFTVLHDAMLLRDKTKHKIYSNLSEKNIHSYLGILTHCDSYNLRNKILAIIDPWNS